MHHDAPHDEPGVHARVEQAAEPEERRVRVAAAHALDEGGEHVVILSLVHLEEGLLYAFLGRLQRQALEGAAGRGVGFLGRGQPGQLQRAQGGAHVAARHAGDVGKRAVLRAHIAPAVAALRVAQGVLQHAQHILRLKGLELEHPAPAHDGRGHADHGVFRGGADEANEAAFDGGQNAVALRLGPAVALVQQQVGGAAIAQAAILRLLEHLAHIRHTAGHSVELFKGAARHAGDDGRQRGLSAAGRAPEDAALQPVGLNGAAQQPARPQKPLLPHKFVKRAGPHALGQRRQGGAFLQAAE